MSDSNLQKSTCIRNTCAKTAPEGPGRRGGGPSGQCAPGPREFRRGSAPVRRGSGTAGSTIATPRPQFWQPKKRRKGLEKSAANAWAGSIRF